jgi:hypothetical protein
VLCICIGFNADLDPAFKVNANPNPGSGCRFFIAQNEGNLEIHKLRNIKVRIF